MHWVFVAAHELSLVAVSGGLLFLVVLRLRAHGLSCSLGCGIFPNQRSEPMSPALAGRLLSTAPPGAGAPLGKSTATPSWPSHFWWIQLVRLKWPSDYLYFPLKVILFWTVHVHCSQSWSQRRAWSRKQMFYIFLPKKLDWCAVFSLCRFITLSCSSQGAACHLPRKLGYSADSWSIVPFTVYAGPNESPRGPRDLTGTSFWPRSSLWHAGLSSFLCYRAQALRCTGSVVEARRLSCPATCGI